MTVLDDPNTDPGLETVDEAAAGPLSLGAHPRARAGFVLPAASADELVLIALADIARIVPLQDRAGTWRLYTTTRAGSGRACLGVYPTLADCAHALDQLLASIERTRR